MESEQKPMGLHSLEQKDCGCEIRRYTGGKTIVNGCKQHKNSTVFVCPVCSKEYSNKQELKKCRWSHAL